MKRKKILSVGMALIVACAAVALAGEAQPEIEVPVPQDGDIVVFLGDSITWQNLYTAYIEAYFIRRYPERKIRFINLGVRGDTAAGAAMRLQRDLFPLHANLVLVMLGMNDGGYRGYNGLLLRYYLAYMNELADQIGERTQARLVFATSTCVEPLDYNKKRYNRMLTAMAAGLRELAARRKVPLIDMFTSFDLALARAGSLSVPVRLMLNAIHPGPAGQLVMAGVLLDKLDPRGERKNMRLSFDLSGAKWKHGRTCLSFSHSHDNIFLPKAARDGLPFVPQAKRFASRRLAIAGLNKQARVYIDKQEQGVFSSQELAAGLDLDLLPRAPWVKEAALLLRLLQEKWRLTYYLWDPRGLGKDAWIQVNPQGEPLIDKDTAYRKLLDVSGRIESLRAQGPHNYTLCLKQLTKDKTSQ
ncbi:MAG TPA: SGNH/GDSL hydrolase family protein [Myxococcota bacterium]|nr:SGNH/GDSL hydrolase family protein [Myxococcota bacterium]